MTRREAQIMALRDSGMALVDIGRELGLSASYVSQVVGRYTSNTGLQELRSFNAMLERGSRSLLQAIERARAS